MKIGSRIISAICLLAIFLSAGIAAGYGRSVEDLVGAFSIEKTIKLGDRSCFEDKAKADPLSHDPSIWSGHLAGSLADSEPPSLAGYDFEPKRVDSTLPQAINFTVHVLDDQSGLASSSVRFRSPSGLQISEACMYPENITAGSINDGNFISKLILPSGSEKGIWLLENLTLYDDSGNRRILGRDALMSSALPTEFLVA